MRVRSPDHDLPDGVWPMKAMAEGITADHRRQRRGLSQAMWAQIRFEAEQRAERFTLRQRAQLLDQARAGDLGAAQVLWQVYHCRVWTQAEIAAVNERVQQG